MSSNNLLGALEVEAGVRRAAAWSLAGGNSASVVATAVLVAMATKLELRHLPTVLGHRSDHADEGGDRVAVTAALRKLPGRQRVAVALRYFADLSVEDTAKVMGCAPGTVKALTHQALAAIRIRLREEPDDGE